MTGSPRVREPQQARSRESFDRAVDAAVRLLQQHGSDSFTLADIAKDSGVSTGSIYGRVASKGDLIRVAHAREMQRLNAETSARFAKAPVGATMPRAVRFAVRALDDLLSRNAAVLAPFMLMANRDPEIASKGKDAYERMTQAFEQAILSAEGAPRGARGHRAVQWSCTVAYSVLARRLGLGSDPEAAPGLPTDKVVKELSLMITAYLSQR